MTPRPAQASRSRPLSAIFIGSSGSTPPTLPDLPEPPSPSTSSNASGLPSPPATNSTGSGSVGEGSTNAGSVRHRTPSFKSNTSSSMSGGAGDRPYDYRKKRSSAIDDEDDADDNENDEDQTARLFDERRRSFPKGADNQAALQRVKSLTQRNRMVLDKLSSISRLGSPAPSNTSRTSRSSPTAVSTSSSAATPSSRLSSSQSRPPSVATSSSTNGRRRETQLSGSETERESQHYSTYSLSSDEGRTTPPPPSALPEIRGASSVRQRRISAPASPGKARAARDKNPGSPGPSRPPGKRVSVALSVDEGYGHYRSDDEDVTAAALAAVASSRRSPTSSGGKKARQPLPREFRERKFSDEKPLPPEPATPHRIATRAELGRASPSPRKTRISTSDPPGSPRRLGQSKYSTVREQTRKHQTRWMSEDLSSPSRERENPGQSFDNLGRRQGHRAGSSEGLLGAAGGRSLVGEGLRAAGLAKRRDEDIFATNGVHAQMPTRRTRFNGNNSVLAGSEVDSSFDQSMDEGSFIDESVGSSHDPKTPMTSIYRLRPQSGLAPRPGTSMAALHHEDAGPPRTAPPVLRSYKSTYALPNRHLEDVQRQSPFDRSSPLGTVRSSTAQGGARDNSDHRKLMLDALSIFESHLSRLPPMGQTTTSTIPEVFQSAQNLVHSLDRLNVMIKEGTSKAMNAQIAAELADYKDGVDLTELWREVGSDHRENLRISDEVVRNMTGFLLGVGKVLRDVTSGNPHLRTLSLDEDIARKMTPEVHLNNSGHDLDGRRSREARRSWEPGKETTRLINRLSSLERNGNTRSRPGSSMNNLRSSTTSSSSEGRSDTNDGTPATLRQSAPVLAPTTAARRLYTPRDHVDSGVTTFSPDDSGGPADYEPSPTPLSRQSHIAFPERRALPPLAVPPSLPTLPSESLLTRSSTSTTSSGDKSSRRKISASSIMTVRPEPAPFTPSIKPPNTTTAVTAATVSISPDTGKAAIPILRSESNSSSRSNGVTFSRPTTTTASTTLTGLRHQHERGARNRKVSLKAAFANVTPPVLAPPVAVSSSLSGSESERERDMRSRTISARPRASLESSRGEESPIDAVRRNLATTVSYSAAKRERRKTVTEIFTPR